MAVPGDQLELTFDTAAGTRTFKYKYVDSNVTSQQKVIDLMNTMIANGEIFEYPPLARKSAQLVKTTVTEISVQ